MTDLKALAARCVDLDESDRGLDAEIHFAILNGVGCGAAQTAPAYLTSLDAAMSLARDGREAREMTSDALDNIFDDEVQADDFLRLLPRYVTAAALLMRSE